MDLKLISRDIVDQMDSGEETVAARVNALINFLILQHVENFLTRKLKA
jgi:hypothetical protein